jgi:hypothetical protein
MQKARTEGFAPGASRCTVTGAMTALLIGLLKLSTTSVEAQTRVPIVSGNTYGEWSGRWGNGPLLMVYLHRMELSGRARSTGAPGRGGRFGSWRERPPWDAGRTAMRYKVRKAAVFAAGQHCRVQS